MKFVITIVFLLFVTTYSQIHYVMTENEDIKLTLSTTDSVYTLLDTVTITMVIENKSNTSFFIQYQNDVEFFYPNELHDIIPYNYGYFEPHLGIMFRLKLLNPAVKDTFIIKMILNVLRPQDKYHKYFFVFDFGYFIYSKSFDYLTIGNDRMVKVEGKESRLFDSYRSFDVGCFPINIKR